MTDTAAILARHYNEHGICPSCLMTWHEAGCDAHQLGVALHKEGALAYRRKHEARAANTNRELAEMRADAAEAREARLRAALDRIFAAAEAAYDNFGVYPMGLFTVIGNEQNALATTPEGETAWLVERGQSMKQVPTVWWTGDEHAPEYGWTTDAYRALRFPSREAATAYIEERSPLPKNRDRWAVAVEHGFIAALATEAE